MEKSFLNFKVSRFLYTSFPPPFTDRATSSFVSDAFSACLTPMAAQFIATFARLSSSISIVYYFPGPKST